MSKNLTLTLKIDANGNLVSVMDQASQKVKTFGKSVDDAGNASDKLSNRLTDMAHIAATVFSVTQVYQFHAALLQTTAQLESMGKAYGAIFGKNEGVQQMQFITSVADQMGLKFADAAQQFKGFAAATAGTALAGAHTQSIFLATASAAATLGLSTEQSGRAFLAMSQMAGKGVVSMEDLRGQLAEAIPGAVGLAANAMGVTIAELNKMVESGTVLSSDLLPKLADELQKMYGASANGASNVTAELNRLDNATTALGAAYTSGWADDATVIIRDMTTFFTDPSVIAGAKSLGESVGTLMRTISDNKEAVLTVTGALIGLLRAGGVGAIVGGIGGFSLSQIINDTDVQRIKSLKAELADLKPNAFNWQSVSWRRKQLEDEIAYLEDWAEVSKSTYKVVYDTAAKAEADKSAAALSEAKKRATIAGQEFDEWSKGIDALNKYDFEQRKKSLAVWEAGERKKASLAQQASKEILQAKKRAQDEAYDHFEKNLQAQEKAQQDYQKSVSDTFDSVRRELDPTIDLYEAYNKKVQAVTASTLAGSADQEAMLKQLQENLNKQLDELRNKNEGTADAVRVAWEQSIKRLDDAFANVWEDIFSGASDFGSSLKRWFTSLLAELAHAAITKPIVISMSGSMGLGGTSSSFAGDPMGVASNANSAYSLWNSFGGMPVGASGSGMMAGLQSAYYAGGNLATANQAIAGAYNSGMYTQAAGTAVATYLPYAANIYGGFQKNGVAGAAVGAAQTYALIQAGAMIGGPAGAAIAAALSMIAGDSIQNGVFGGARGERVRNVQLGYGEDGARSSSIRATHYDAGWGRSGSWTEEQLFDVKTQQAINATIESMVDGIKSNADRLGYAVNDAFNVGLEADIMGKTAEETAQIIADLINDIGSKAVESITDNAGVKLSDFVASMAIDGEKLGQTFNRVMTQFDAFNYPVGRLNDSLATLSISTLSAVDSLVSMAGGMQNLQALQSGFVNAFYTDAQKAELTTQSISTLFDGLGMAVPPTSAALIDLIGSLDLTTEAGQRAYTAITGSTAILKEYYDVQQQNIASQQRSYDDMLSVQKQAAQDAYNQQQASINAQKELLKASYDARLTALNAEKDAINKTVTAINSLKTSLASTYKGITQNTANTMASYMTGQQQLMAALSQAKAGNLPQVEQVQDALTAVSQNTANYYASFEDYARDQSITSMVIAELMALSDDQLTTQNNQLTSIDQQLTQLKAQYDFDAQALDRQLEASKLQLDALDTINTSILSLKDSMTSSIAAIGAKTAASGANSASGSSSSYNSKWLTGDAVTGYVEGYGVTDILVGQGYMDMVNSTAGAYGMTAQAFDQWINPNSYQYRDWTSYVPGYASGGEHIGGIRLVGENGPELEVTGPSRIFNAQQTQNILRGANNGNSDALVQRLINEVSALREENKQLLIEIKNSSKRSAEKLEKFDKVGMPTLAVT